MKLTKILLLVPALMIAGCKGDNKDQSSAQEDINKITKEVWDATIGNFYMFRPQNNMTLKLDIFMEGEGGMTIAFENDYGKMREGYETPSEDDHYYKVFPDGYDKSKETYTAEGYYYVEQDECWEKYETVYRIYSMAELTYAVCAPDFNEVTYDENSHSYKVEELVYYTNLGKTNPEYARMLLRNAEFKFENNDLTDFSYDYSKMNDGDKPSDITEMVNLTYKLINKGTTKVTLPEVE